MFLFCFFLHKKESCHPTSFVCVFFVRVFPFEITEAVQHKRVLHGENRQPEPIRLFTVEFFRYDETHHQQWRGLTLFLQNCLSIRHTVTKWNEEFNRANPIFFFFFFRHPKLYFVPQKTIKWMAFLIQFSLHFCTCVVRTLIFVFFFYEQVRSFAVCFPRYCLPTRKHVPQRPAPRSNHKLISW